MRLGIDRARAECLLEGVSLNGLGPELGGGVLFSLLGFVGGF